MGSLQQPKVITMRGSDGAKYQFLCKPKDDLRKDNRMNELDMLLNRLLKRDPSCRRRNLYIRTYSVIPLNEQNGLVQWVDNTTPLRDVIYKYYDSSFKEKIRASIKKLEKKLPNVQLFKDYFLAPALPSVFHKYFLGSKRN